MEENLCCAVCSFVRLPCLLFLKPTPQSNLWGTWRGDGLVSLQLFPFFPYHCYLAALFPVSRVWFLPHCSTSYLSAETYWATLSFLCYGNTQTPPPDCTVRLRINQKQALSPKAKTPVRCNRSTLKLANKKRDKPKKLSSKSFVRKGCEREEWELQQGRSKKMMMLPNYNVWEQGLLGKDARQVIIWIGNDTKE